MLELTENEAWQTERAEWPFRALLGETITGVELDEDMFYVKLGCASGRKWVLVHEQDCCEIVQIEEYDGNFNDLIGQTISLAEEASVADARWTFYVLGCPNGIVHMRWYGDSNGYYSTHVSLMLEDGPQPEYVIEETSHA